jgi:putative PIN family toxin of toxin-antitoxin system
MRPSRIVIDTNVLISGFRSRDGTAFRLLQLIPSRKFEVHLSVPLVMEYRDVLLRQLPNLYINEDDVGSFIGHLCSQSQLHDIYYLWRPTLRDPNDEMLLEVAVKAQCDFIVTFNGKDFKGAEQFEVEIVSPQTFLREIGEL